MPAAKKATEPKLDEPVLAGPPAEGDTPTVAVGDAAPESANLTGDGPDEPSGKTVTMKSPWGSQVTVSADIAHHFK